MIVTEEAVTGYKTCLRNLRKDGYCKGYESAPAQLIREVVQMTFIDGGGDDARVENTFEYLRPARVGTDDVCDVCGGGVNLSLGPREEYDRVAGPSPMEIIRGAAEERERDRSIITAAERSAAATEQRTAEAAAHEQQMRALLERQAAATERANELKAVELGLQPAAPEQRPSDIAPRPRRKSAS